MENIVGQGVIKSHDCNITPSAELHPHNWKLPDTDQTVVIVLFEPLWGFEEEIGSGMTFAWNLNALNRVV